MCGAGSSDSSRQSLLRASVPRFASACGYPTQPTGGHTRPRLGCVTRDGRPRHRRPQPPLPPRLVTRRGPPKPASDAAASPIATRTRIKPKSADKPGSVTALARYGRHSSRRAVAGALEPPTRGLGEQRRRPPIWCCSGWRLPRFTRRGVTRGDSSLWPCSSPSSAALTATYSGRALPGIPLCGARTFLPPVSRAATVWLASDRKDTPTIRRATRRFRRRARARRAACRTDIRTARSTTGA